MFNLSHVLEFVIEIWQPDCGFEIYAYDASMQLQFANGRARKSAMESVEWGFACPVAL
ncbi:MAG: hypothetical protein NC115_03505 [Bacteroidales bacterium]|nr:hypothetical protein [Bacteroides sp.]MCM1197796.1 hypothetical protein [Clostridium sp.]MCM1501719.1 hypothetical protein [Bacteroidales bacterium]